MFGFHIFTTFGLISPDCAGQGGEGLPPKEKATGWDHTVAAIV
jgi:hypothetical protein